MFQLQLVEAFLAEAVTVREVVRVRRELWQGKQWVGRDAGHAADGVDVGITEVDAKWR